MFCTGSPHGGRKREGVTFIAPIFLIELTTPLIRLRFREEKNARFAKFIIKLGIIKVGFDDVRVVLMLISHNLMERGFHRDKRPELTFSTP